MKWLVFIASLTVLLSCKQSETTSESNSSSSTEIINDNPPIKEAIFLTMERTPCFGRCPHYKITIMNTGKVIYDGIQFTDKTGKFTKKLSTAQLTQIQNRIEEINLFEMNDKYDSNVTDIPATALFISYKGGKKKIFNRHGAPIELKEFEKLIDSIVIDDALEQIKD